MVISLFSLSKKNFFYIQEFNIYTEQCDLGSVYDWICRSLLSWASYNHMLSFSNCEGLILCLVLQSSIVNHKISGLLCQEFEDNFHTDSTRLELIVCLVGNFYTITRWKGTELYYPFNVAMHPRFYCSSSLYGFGFFWRN